MKRDAGLIAGAVLLLYGFTLFFPPPPIDTNFLADNGLLKLPWPSFVKALCSRYYFTLSGEATYQPLITVLHYFFGGSPALLRLMSLVMLAAASWLVRELAEQLGLSPKTALLCGVLFAAAPAVTEAVAVPSFAGHLLGAGFVLLCVLCGLRALEGGRRERRWLAGAYLSFALGCLSKETVVIAPALLAAAWACDARRAPWPRAARALAGFAALGGAYLVWRFIGLEPSPAPPAHRADAMLSLGWYTRMLLWPWPLCFEHAGLPPGLIAFAGLFVLAGTSVVFRPALMLGWLWILVSLLPYLHIIPFAHTSPVADRYLLLAAAGLCLWLGRLLDSRKGRLVLGVLAAAWASLTLQRNGQLIDEPVVCAQTAACAPDSVPAQLMLGNSQLKRGLIKEAKASYTRAVMIDPNSPMAWNDLGVADWQAGLPGSALSDFRRSLELQEQPMVRENLEEALKARATSAPGRKRPRAPSPP